MKKNLSFIFCFVFFVTAHVIAQTPLQSSSASSNAVESKSEIPITKIEFEESTFEFGELIEGEIIQNVFTFTNTGNEPLIISNAKGSCGCTVPRWPKEPIMPGEKAELLVQFNSKGKGRVGGAMNSKRVTLTANIDPQNVYLTIKGTVFKSEEKEKLNPAAAKRSKDFDISSESVLIYPNPTMNELNVNLKAFSGKKALVEIFNLEGKRMDSKNVAELNQNAILFDVSQYPAGTYTTSVKVDGKNRIAKQFMVPQH